MSEEEYIHEEELRRMELGVYWDIARRRWPYLPNNALVVYVETSTVEALACAPPVVKLEQVENMLMGIALVPTSGQVILFVGPCERG